MYKESKHALVVMFIFFSVLGGIIYLFSTDYSVKCVNLFPNITYFQKEICIRELQEKTPLEEIYNKFKNYK